MSCDCCGISNAARVCRSLSHLSLNIPLMKRPSHFHRSPRKWRKSSVHRGDEGIPSSPRMRNRQRPRRRSRSSTRKRASLTTMRMEKKRNSKQNALSIFRPKFIALRRPNRKKSGGNSRARFVYVVKLFFGPLLSLKSVHIVHVEADIASACEALDNALAGTHEMRMELKSLADKVAKSDVGATSRPCSPMVKNIHNSSNRLSMVRPHVVFGGACDADAVRHQSRTRSFRRKSRRILMWTSRSRRSNMRYRPLRKKRPVMSLQRRTSRSLASGLQRKASE